MHRAQASTHGAGVYATGVGHAGYFVGHTFFSGNVGIGKDYPTEKLIVKVGGPLWSDPHFAIEAVGTTNKWDFTVGASDILYIGFNESTKVVVDTDGKVGIGTGSPQGKLDVNGAIYQRGSSLHADFVFESRGKIEAKGKGEIEMWFVGKIT